MTEEELIKILDKIDWDKDLDTYKKDPEFIQACQNYKRNINLNTPIVIPPLTKLESRYFYEIDYIKEITKSDKVLRVGGIFIVIKMVKEQNCHQYKYKEN
jgi:hypothetical protein